MLKGGRNGVKSGGSSKVPLSRRRSVMFEGNSNDPFAGNSEILLNGDGPPNGTGPQFLSSAPSAHCGIPSQSTAQFPLQSSSFGLHRSSDRSSFMG